MDMMGMAVILFIITAAAFGYWMLIATRRHRNLQEAAGKVWAEVILKVGHCASCWVPYDANTCGTVYLKIDGNKLIPVDPPKKVSGADAAEDAKEVLGAGIYVFNEDAIIKEWWPHTKGLRRATESIERARVIWHEGISEPVSNRHMSQWMRHMMESHGKPADEEECQELGIIASPNTMTTMVDTSSMMIVSALQEQIQEHLNAVVTMTKKWVSPLLIYAIGALALIGFGACLVYNGIASHVATPTIPTR